jgi:hypothetical protein
MSKEKIFFLFPFIHLLGAYFMPGPALGTGDWDDTKQAQPALKGLTVWLGHTAR